MKWNQYLELSEKTLSTQFHCEEKEQLLLHAVIGVLTEVEELLDNHISHNDKEVNLDPVNILEESGDVLWYLAIIGRMYDIKPTDLSIVSQVGTPMNIILAVIKETCKMLDMLKKKLYYNKSIDEQAFASSAKLVVIFIQDYMSHFNINIEDSFDININKLKARYGEKFSSERAINRDLETERVILEKRSN
jgi:NTP pyrophosphatase (non-canonical NTP hydrolase)